MTKKYENCYRRALPHLKRKADLKVGPYGGPWSAPTLLSISVLRVCLWMQEERDQCQQ
jgi:hypothetical protein